MIQSLTIVNPYNPGQILTLKDTFVDIKAVLADGSIVVIEMQVAAMTAFNKRVTYNLAKAYSNQLVTGEDYPLLNPAIAVTITDFILFKETADVINKFVFQEVTKKFKLLDDQLQLVFVELPKFQKTIGELQTLTDKWLYFLKHAASLDSIPESLGAVSEINFALNLANQASMTVDELAVVDRRGMLLQDERGRLAYAEAQGRFKRAIALVKRLLQKRFGEIPATISSQIENLPLGNLENLTEEILDFESLSDLAVWLENR